MKVVDVKAVNIQCRRAGCLFL